MRKIILFLILGLVFTPLCFGEPVNAERETSKYYTGTGVIKASPATIFGITMTASTGAGWIAVYDASSNTGITASTEPIIEIQNATQYNTIVKDFANGHKVYNGIYIEGTTAHGVIYYY
jgi:hypothetical protein